VHFKKQNSYGKDGKISEITVQHYTILEKYEKDLLEKIPSTMIKLEKKFKDAPTS